MGAKVRGVRSQGRAIALLVLVLVAPPVAAQDPPPEPPGPFVIDLRGAMAPIPDDVVYFPTLGTGSAIPARGFGFDVGGHVYPFSLGISRVGIGANFMRIRGIVEDVAATVTTLAPQVSFNFGTRAGWSYLSAGYGTAEIRTLAGDDLAEPGRVSAINVGGGARWFLKARLAVGFDVRFHRLGAGDETPGAMLGAASVGFSLR